MVLPPVRIPIFHPYSDSPDGDIIVQAYAYEEAFGEKIRALAERARPRDLYDVVNLYRNIEARPSAEVLLEVLTQKCEYKGIPVPKAANLDPFSGQLEAGWEHMLRHQLPALPPVESFWNVVPEFFAWLQGAGAQAIPSSYPGAPGETILRERTLRLLVVSRVQSDLEVVRFAAAIVSASNLSIREARGASSRIRCAARRTTTSFCMLGMSTRASTEVIEWTGFEASE